MQAQFDSNRQFGVEIETSMRGPRIQTIVDALNEAGIPTANTGYTHRTMSTWKVVPDGSTGPEVVSPPLRGQAGLDEVARVCEVLTAIGCSVDRSTGLHVHHDFNDGSKAQLKSILFLYAKAQILTQELLPTRVNTHWCRPISASAITYMDSRMNRIARQVGQEADLRFYAININSGRYYAVNPQAYSNHGTIEFRQHSGSLNASKIQAWIVFTQNIVSVGMAKKIGPQAFKYAQAGSVIYALGRDTNCDVTKKARMNIIQRIFENAQRRRGVQVDMANIGWFLDFAKMYLTPAQRRTLRRQNNQNIVRQTGDQLNQS
tara:strand:- start:454 stop:1407 length:954 start_codon:yes stop_codon:yes gene_type:complete